MAREHAGVAREHAGAREQRGAAASPHGRAGAQAGAGAPDQTGGEDRQRTGGEDRQRTAGEDRQRTGGEDRQRTIDEDRQRTDDEDHQRTGDEDHERQLEHDIEQLTAKAEKAEEYLELAQRTRADFENYRKRAAREAAVAQERGITKLAKELLPAVDNLDRALDAAESAVAPPADGAPTDNGTATLISGIKLVHEDVISALARAGIERFSPEGERFDPQQHEAIAQQPVEGKESGTVVEVYQRGYRLGEVVIRPARVVVAA